MIGLSGIRCLPLGQSIRQGQQNHTTGGTSVRLGMSREEASSWLDYIWFSNGFLIYDDQLCVMTYARLHGASQLCKEDLRPAQLTEEKAEVQRGPGSHLTAGEWWRQDLNSFLVPKNAPFRTPHCLLNLVGIQRALNVCKVLWGLQKVIWTAACLSGVYLDEITHHLEGITVAEESRARYPMPHGGRKKRNCVLIEGWLCARLCAKHYRIYPLGLH